MVGACQDQNKQAGDGTRHSKLCLYTCVVDYWREFFYDSGFGENAYAGLFKELPFHNRPLKARSDTARAFFLRR